MGERTFVKSGELFLQNKGILKTSWQNKYCLLYGGSGDKSCHLEFFENRKSFEENRSKNKPCDKKVEIQNVKSITNSAQAGSDGTPKYQIEIKCKNNTCLMFDSESECADWFSKLQSETGFSLRGSNSSQNREDENENDINEDYDDESEVITLNQMYDGTGGAQAQRFLVNVEPCPLAKLCDIEGAMTMLVTNQCISFEDPKTRQNKYLFQLSWMRRFGKREKDQFYFECGRKCPNGEGTVTCISQSAAEIHKVITTKSSSNASTVIPGKQKVKGLGEKKALDLKPSEKLLDVKPKVSSPAPNITGPSFVQKRNHPGPANVPTLVPIKTEASEYDDCVSVTTLRNSIGKVSGNDASVGHLSQNTFTQELEGKLHAGDDHAKHVSVKKLSVTESKKEKKDREKREKKEAEEREKREKKEAEEREKREKKEAEEREKEKLRREKKEKEEKEKKMKEDKKKGKKDNSIKNRSAGAYDDVDEDASSTSVADDVTYAEATNPTNVRKSKSPKSGDVLIYDDPDVAKAMPRQEPPQYAEPYRTGGGVSIVADDDGNAYSEVKGISKAAWEHQGREEKEMCHEEDYSVLKQSRQQRKGPPPDLPARRYSQSDSEEESTYDTTAPNVSRKSGGIKPENLYGMASAKKVGLMLPNKASAGNDPEDSGEEEENEYSHCAEPDTYEKAVTVSEKKSQPSVQPSSLYEDADRPVAKASIKAPKSKPAPTESLYEEVKM